MKLKYILNLFITLLLILNIKSSLNVSASEKGEREKLPKKQICLIDNDSEYSSPIWLQEFIQYTQQKGRQLHRLETELDYFRYNIRFVKNTTNLSVGYGLLNKDNLIDIPSLSLNPEVYETLAELGTTIKVVNGYVQNLDEDKLNKSFTPPQTGCDLKRM